MSTNQHFLTRNNRSSDALAPASDPKSLSERWGDTIQKIEDSFSKSLEQDASQMPQHSVQLLCRPRGNLVEPPNDYFSVLFAPGVVPVKSRSSPYIISRRALREWIQLQKPSSDEDVRETKRYFERCVGLLHAFVLKLVVTVMNEGRAELEVTVDPKWIATDNLVVHHSLEEGESLQFLQTGSNEHNPNANDANIKYGAMRALGMVAYELLVRGAGPPIMSFLPATITNSDGAAELLLSINDNTADFGTKRQKSECRNQCMISSAMMNAGVPFPLCRFVVDLLGGECSDGLLFRSDNSFESFSDVVGDLKQMMQNPEAFIHQAVKDQWKLAFGEKMHGRDAEKQQLLEAASRITGTTSNDALFEALAGLLSNNKQQIAMVTGRPGSGKTRLVMETRKSLENQGWLFLCCKFDRIVHSEPLSIMASAFDDFLRQCIGNSRQHRIQTSLNMLMQPNDVAILTKHVPHLINYYAASPIESTNEFQVNREQIHKLFCKLIEVLSVVGPVAFFMDDLQWADATSIGLFLALTKSSEPNLSCNGCDKGNQKMMFIGSYRDNEVDDNPELVGLLEQLRNNKFVQLTEVEVGGFDNDTLNGIISESLCLPLRRTKLLTETILQKTDGIIIHIIEFVGRLTMERILCHSFVKGWEWDSEVIESCPISESVAELFTFKLKTLSDEALVGLKICSIFGILIDRRIIDLTQGYDNERGVDINIGVKAATELGLIEATGSPNVLKFAHDLIAQAAFDLMSVEERSQLLQKLTAALIKNATVSNEVDMVVFVIVDLINRMDKESVATHEERVLYATMNDKAGKKALAVPDFTSALKYSESAISFLDPSDWESHHDILLSAHETSVLALYSCANRDQDLFQTRINQVLEHAKSLEEEFETRFVWIRFLSTTSLERAIHECHLFLQRLGETIKVLDISPSLAISELVKVKEKFLEEQKDVLTPMVDSTKLKAMKVLASLFVFYYFQQNSLQLVVSSRMVEVTMQYGWSEESTFALATFGSLLAISLGDIDEGSVWCRVALQLMAKSCSNKNALLPRVYAAVYGYVLVWKEPLQSTTDQLMQACQLCFDCGDVNFAGNLVQLYPMRAFQCGKNVNTLLKEVEVLAHKCGVHGQTPIIQYCLAPLYNVLRGLMGLDEVSLPPLRVYIDNDELRNHGRAKAGPVNFDLQIGFELTKSFLFRDMEKAREMVEIDKANTFTKKRLVYSKVLFNWFASLTACYFTRQNGDNSQMVDVQNFCDQLEYLSRHSQWNMANKYQLLKAECHYSEGEMIQAAEAYESSIKAAKNHKFIHETALACELAGYFHKEQGNEEKAKSMFTQARDAYNKWGAVVKAKLIPL